MSATLDFIQNQGEKYREILHFIDDLMLSYDGVVCKIRYRIPFHYKNHWICYANPRKNDGVELVFLRANQFKGSIEPLDARGRKQVAGLIIQDLKDIPDELTDVINKALDIDDSTAYKSKRVK